MTVAEVVAQLVEWLLPTPEICGSNPDIGKLLSTNCKIEEMEIKKKRPGFGPSLKKIWLNHLIMSQWYTLKFQRCL